MAEDRQRLLDAYLAAAARAGDARAFEALVRRWNAKLTAHAWRLLGDGELAKDAAQDGWAEIARAIGALRDERAFAAFAYRIVSRCCARQISGSIRDRALRRAVSAEPAPAPEERPGEGELAQLRAAVRTLPADQRAAIALFYFEEMSVAEVAVALDVPAGTVKTRLFNARLKLRAVLEGDAS